MHALCQLSTTELAARIRAGDVTSRAVVEAHLARIEACNDAVAAVALVLTDDALAAAARADRIAPTGPLHGVPVTVKSNLDCTGSPTTHGVGALRHAVPWVDAPAVARLKAAGAIVIGRTNVSEMGLRVDMDGPLHGRTHNPWDRTVSAGGSSGGDAAAVATGMAPLGLGNDGGGSLRVPAHFCGVAALKPTTGRIPHASSLPPEDFGLAFQLMTVDGPVARTVADLQLALSVLAGRDPRDPRSVDVPLVGPATERRAGLVTTLPGPPLPPQTVSAIEHAGTLLARAGWTVEEVEPPELPWVGELWARLLASDLAVLTPTLAPVLTPALGDHLRRIVARWHTEEVSAHRLHTERSRLIRAWSQMFARTPVVVGPTWSGPPLAPDADLDPDGGLDLLGDATRLVVPGNLLGFPSVAVPTGPASGLPTGVQVLADLWREDLCLQAAAVIEAGSSAGVPLDPRW